MPPAKSNPVDELQRLLLWGREKGFRIGPAVELGDLKLFVTDLRQAKNEKFAMDDDGAPVDGGVYVAAGLKAEDEPVDGTS